MNVFVVTQKHEVRDTCEAVSQPRVVLVTDDQALAREIVRWRSDAEEGRVTYRVMHEYPLNKMLS